MPQKVRAPCEIISGATTHRGRGSALRWFTQIRLKLNENGHARSNATARLKRWVRERGRERERGKEPGLSEEVRGAEGEGQ